MRLELRRLSRETLIYGTGLLLARGIGFLLIPLYTRYLSPADYGVLDLVELASFILGCLFLLGIDEALLREYHSGTDPEQKAAVTATALWFSLGYSTLVVLLLLPFSTILTKILIGDTRLSNVFALALVAMITGSTVTVAKTALRAQQRSVTYTTVSLVSTFLAVSLNIFFLSQLHLGVYGILLSTLINSAVLSVWLFWDLLRPVGRIPRLDAPKLLSMLKYGVPFVPVALASFVVNWSDRYFLRVYSTLTTVGLYAFGYKLGMIVIFLVNAPFLLVWNSYLFEIKNKPNGPPTTWWRFAPWASPSRASLNSS
jgi:O-antigen/teichoic acid export membrane protein